MIFENRFMHASELQRLGAHTRSRDIRFHVIGPTPADRWAIDRVGFARSASLVLAGLAAEAKTWIDRVYHIDRGYEKIEEKLRTVGAGNRARQIEADEDWFRHQPIRQTVHFTCC